MNPLAAPSRGGPSGRQTLDFQIVGLCLVAAGIFAAYPFDYLCVVIPAILPLYAWVRAGTPGIPTLPIVAGLFVIYYAAPVLRGDLQTDDADRILSAAISVASFLLSATLVYQLFLTAAARRVSRDDRRLSPKLMVELTFLGLGGGIVFYLVLFAGWLDWIADYIGVIRAAGLTFASIGCYLAGAARADGVLRGGPWVLAVLCVAALALLAIGGLLLVGGAVSVLAAILGYVVAARRIPWLTLALTFAVINVLQAGKAEIRDTYWDPDRQASVSEIPAIMLGWFEDGARALWSGTEQIDVLERASLLWTVIRVQEATPDYVPYLRGESYALLPAIILPRFIEPNKIKSQAGLNMLAVRYGFQTQEGTDRTTIGFGLIAEAYANFGSGGVLAVGVLFGALCGAITWFSTGIALVSLRMFMAIAATTVLLNVEADLSYLVVTILQALGGVLLAAIVSVVITAVAQSRPGLPTSGEVRQGVTARGRVRP